MWGEVVSPVTSKRPPIQLGQIHLGAEFTFKIPREHFYLPCVTVPWRIMAPSPAREIKSRSDNVTGSWYERAKRPLGGALFPPFYLLAKCRLLKQQWRGSEQGTRI
jgi:hypothetical protein